MTAPCQGFTPIKIDINDILECRTRRRNGDRERVRVETIEAGCLVGRVINPLPGKPAERRRIAYLPAIKNGGGQPGNYRKIESAPAVTPAPAEPTRQRRAWVETTGYNLDEPWSKFASIDMIRSAPDAAVASRAVIIAENLPDATPKTIAAAWHAWCARQAGAL